MSFKFLLTSQNKLPILQDGPDVITWKEVKQHIVGIQSLLINLGAKECVLLSKDGLEFTACLLACHYLGVNLILPPNETEEIMDLLEDYCWIGDHPRSLSYGKEDGQICNNQQDSKLTIFTSGSTGVPKQITRCFSQMMLEVEEINQIFGQHLKSPLFVATVSNQHIYGLLFALLWPLKQGYIVNRNTIPFEETLDEIGLQHPELTIISSPAFLKRLSLKNSASGQHWNLFSSGGILNNKLAKTTSELLQASVIQVYGSSETGGIAYKNIAQDWQFFPSVQKDSRNETLRINSPFCYTSGWYDTNDKIRMTKTGFELLGRKDKIVKIEEKRVSLIQVEREIKNHCWVQDVFAIAITEKRQFIATVIVMNKQGKSKFDELGAKYIKQSIKGFVKPKLEILAIPRQIRFVEEIPQNTQGKTPYQLIRALFTA